MYADRRYQSAQSRTVSFGAAFAVNGAIIAGILFFLAPKFVAAPDPVVLKSYPVPIDQPPPPIPIEKPKIDARTPQAPVPTAPTPEIRTPTLNTSTATDVIPPTPPSTEFIEKVGPTVIEPVTPPTPVLPPLIGARQDPKYLRDFQPAYPASELRSERSGTVSLRALIGVDGRVKQVQQVSATSPAFFEAARKQALSKWRFKPATRGGVPEESWKVMTVTFRIENQ